jgi:hypothetical protein
MNGDVNSQTGDSAGDAKKISEHRIRLNFHGFNGQSDTPATALGASSGAKG